MYAQNLLQDKTSKKYAYKSDAFIYTEFSTFTNGFAFVNKGDKYAFINIHGDTLCPFEYDLVQSFNVNGLSLVGKDSLWGIIDTLNRTRVPINYQEVYFETPNCASVLNEQSWQLILISNSGNKKTEPYKLKPYVKNGNVFIPSDSLGLWENYDFENFFSEIRTDNIKN